MPSKGSKKNEISEMTGLEVCVPDMYKLLSPIIRKRTISAEKWFGQPGSAA